MTKLNTIPRKRWC